METKVGRTLDIGLRGGNGLDPSADPMAAEAQGRSAGVGAGTPLRHTASANTLSLAQLNRYATAHDTGYPAEFRYVHKMQRLTSPKRDDITALYALMHLMDDIADDPDFRKEDRNLHLDGFMECLESQISWSEHQMRQAFSLPSHYRVGDLDGAELLALLQEILLRYDIPLERFRDLATNLSVCNTWPDEPHFENYSELDEYNDVLFRCVASCLSDVLFSNISHEIRHHYNFGFTKFMQGMQMINLMMDLEEDAEKGHYFLPKESYWKKKSMITPEAYVRLLIAGNRYFDEADFLMRDEAIEIDVRSFFCGLKEIHDGLRASRFVLGRFEQALDA